MANLIRTIWHCLLICQIELIHTVGGIVTGLLSYYVVVTIYIVCIFVEILIMLNDMDGLDWAVLYS